MMFFSCTQNGIRALFQRRARQPRLVVSGILRATVPGLQMMTGLFMAKARFVVVVVGTFPILTYRTGYTGILQGLAAFRRRRARFLAERHCQAKTCGPI